jgi:hypothetical protein
MEPATASLKVPAKVAYDDYGLSFPTRAKDYGAGCIKRPADVGWQFGCRSGAPGCSICGEEVKAWIRNSANISVPDTELRILNMRL